MLTYMLLCVALSGTYAQEENNYFGKKIGDFVQQATPSLSHLVQGSVYAIDSRTLWVRGFTYDGKAPDAFFWAGSSSSPDSTGEKIPDEQGRLIKLESYDNQNLILYLPNGKVITDYTWVSIWCREISVNFAQVSIPSPFEAPTTYNLGPLGFDTLVHETEADRVEIVDSQTVIFYNLKYDGRGPAAYFWVGPGSPSINGNRVPDEDGDKITRLRAYTGENIKVTFDGDKTVFDYDYIGLWCEAAVQNFGHVEIPNMSNLNIPPALPQMEQVSDYDNCEPLTDQYQVSWSIIGDVIDIQLTGRVNTDDYMAFGISGSQERMQMIGADVTVAWFDAVLLSGQAVDYDLTDLAQCAGGNGACPDTMTTNPGEDNIINVTATMLDGIISIAFSRKLNTGDANDKNISSSGLTQTVWAIGQINSDGLAVRHINRGGVELGFGRTPAKNCPSLAEADDKIVGWSEVVLVGREDNTIFTTTIGQSGGQIGYSSITNNIGWGISWYINDILVPRIIVKRHVTYTFNVHGGDDPSLPAQYHPFYITDDKAGGFASVSNNQSNSVIYAGPVSGSLCELTDKSGDQSANSNTAEEYRNTLQENCLAPKQPGVLTWTPDGDTPDTVYYQCYTHRYLGWKIDVRDELPSSAALKSAGYCAVLLTLVWIRMIHVFNN